MLTRRMLFGALLATACLPASALAQTTIKAAQIEAMMNDIAQGRDPAFTQPIAPGWSLTADRSLADRIREINARLAQEIERVATVFINAAAGEKIAATKAVVAAIDPETARDGAAYVFEGSGPSMGITRLLLFVPTATLGADAVDKVVAVSTKFVRSPKTDDTYYEYSDPANLKQSTVLELPGSDTSWTTDARPPMAPDQVYALKKCRHLFILGWYCNTSVYQLRDLPGSGGQVKLMVSLLYSLPAGADNAQFTDARAENVLDGTSAIYVLLVAGDQIMIYSPAVQSKSGSLSMQDMLNSGLKEQYGRLVSRLSTELGIGKLPY
jgi:hypothetical protein